MENASDAIKIAGGVLIALMVTSLMIFGFSRIKYYKKQEEISKKDVQTAEFNKEFESYNKRVVTGYELTSLANYTNDINERYKQSDGYTEVKVYITLEKDNRLRYISNKLQEEDYPVFELKKGERKYNLINYVKEISNPTQTSDSTIKKDESEIQLIFKHLYFECTNVEYDGKNGRVCEIDYKQIHATNK